MGNQEAKINPRLVRKHTATVVNKNMPELKQCIGMHFHNLGTAEKKYAIFDEERATPSTSVKLKKGAKK